MGRIITLTTDFGIGDHFVGAMKGVILGISPSATLVDICHGLPAQDILGGALALEAAVPCFQPGTIHLAVIDPGVGSERAAIAVEAERHLYVAPDNGLLSLALMIDPMVRAVRLTNPRYQRYPVSATFHGRDLFAPAAAHLAVGVPLAELGEPVDALSQLDISVPRDSNGKLKVHVIHVDRFGNLLTDLTGPRFAVWRSAVPEGIDVLAGNATIRGIGNTYTDVPIGAPVAYFGSGGRLEVGVRNGNAAEELRMAVGAEITIQTRA